MLRDTSDASLFENLLSGKGAIKAGDRVMGARSRHQRCSM